MASVLLDALTWLFSRPAPCGTSKDITELILRTTTACAPCTHSAKGQATHRSRSSCWRGTSSGTAAFTQKGRTWSWALPWLPAPAAWALLPSRPSTSTWRSCWSCCCTQPSQTPASMHCWAGTCGTLRTTCRRRSSSCCLA